MPLPTMHKKRIENYLEDRGLTGSEIKTILGEDALVMRAMQAMRADHVAIASLIRLTHLANPRLRLITVTCGNCANVYPVNGDGKCPKCEHDNRATADQIRALQAQQEEAKEKAEEAKIAAADQNKVAAE